MNLIPSYTSGKHARELLCERLHMNTASTGRDILQYQVSLSSNTLHTCKDYLWSGQKCKHLYAVFLWFSENFEKVFASEVQHVIAADTPAIQSQSILQGRKQLTKGKKRGPKRKQRLAKFGFRQKESKKESEKESKKDSTRVHKNRLKSGIVYCQTQKLCNRRD